MREITGLPGACQASPRLGFDVHIVTDCGIDHLTNEVFLRIRRRWNGGSYCTPDLESWRASVEDLKEFHSDRSDPP